MQAAQKVILENVNWSQSIVMCLECRKLIEQRLSQLLAVLVALVADLDQCQVLEVHGCVCVCVDVNEYWVSSLLFVCVCALSRSQSTMMRTTDALDVRRNGTREEVHAAMAARRAAKL